MDDMAGRLKKFRTDKKLSQRELSRLTGIEQATLSRIERGEMSLLSPHVNTLSKALGVAVPKLLGIVSNITPVQVGSRHIPVLSFEQVQRFPGSVSLAEDVEMSDYVLVDLPHSASTFAVRIQDRSMEAVFNPGDVIVIDPVVDVVPGDYVLATESSGETLFRRYRDLGVNEQGNREFELVPLNKLHASIRSDRMNITIKGVMVEHRMYRKAK